MNLSASISRIASYSATLPVLLRPAIVALIMAMAFITTGSALAHHSYVSQYDAKKRVTVQGVVQSVSYQNPHIFFDLTVADKSGGSTTWRVETESIPKARAKGLTENVLREGVTAKIMGWPARDGSAAIGLGTITIGGKSMTIRSTPR